MLRAWLKDTKLCFWSCLNLKTSRALPEGKESGIRLIGGIEKSSQLIKNKSKKFQVDKIKQLLNL